MHKTLAQKYKDLRKEATAAHKSKLRELALQEEIAKHLPERYQTQARILIHKGEPIVILQNPECALCSHNFTVSETLAAVKAICAKNPPLQPYKNSQFETKPKTLHKSAGNLKPWPKFHVTISGAPKTHLPTITLKFWVQTNHVTKENSIFEIWIPIKWQEVPDIIPNSRGGHSTRTGEFVGKIDEAKNHIGDERITWSVPAGTYNHSYYWKTQDALRKGLSNLKKGKKLK